MENEEFSDQQAVIMKIDGTLDLHTFRPGEIKFLIPDYIQECQKRNISNLRIIHGKGKGILRRTVHAILARHPEVINYKLADESAGSWGATLVTLREKRP